LDEADGGWVQAGGRCAMRVAILATDNREPFKDYANPLPHFGTAPEALLQGFASILELEVHIVSCLQQPVAASGKIAGNIFYHGLHVPKIGWLRTFYQGCIRAVRAKLREIKPDIVHGQGTERDCAISAVFSGFPNVVTIHGNMAELARMFGGPFGSFMWFAARLEDFALRRTDGVFCNSSYTRELVEPRTNHVWSVANPIRQAFFDQPLCAAEKKCILLNVGVVSPRKRQLEVLDVAAELRRRGFCFELHFVGLVNPADGYCAKFLQRISEWKDNGFVRHTPHLSANELIVLLDRASGLVHIPVEESFGLVVAESIARGMKFFGTRTGGVIDIACGLPDAELFAADDLVGLTDAIARWIAVGYPRSTCGAGMMRERYHPTVIARQHLEIYREVLLRHRHRASS
jgi:glycosyltransferase involved in cell wall biosynthesis